MSVRKVIEKEKETRKERRSRIGSHAISSSMSMRDHRQQPCITCTTFNILAPIYKRLQINNDQDQNSRESDYRAYWLVRNQRILDSLLRERSSIICLQYLLRRASLTEEDAFAFPVTALPTQAFCEALQHLNLTGHCSKGRDSSVGTLIICLLLCRRQEVKIIR